MCQLQGTEKSLFSQRSLSLSIIQSQQNREAWRAQQHHSELEILYFVLFLKSQERAKISDTNKMFPAMSPVKDINILLQCPLSYHKVSKMLSHRAIWTASWLLDIVQLFFKLSASFFFFLVIFVLTWKGQQTQRRQTAAGLERSVWHLFFFFWHSRKTSESERSSAIKEECTWCELLCVKWPIIAWNRPAFKVQRKLMVQDNTSNSFIPH